jgi:hypothetical protein
LKKNDQFNDLENAVMEALLDGPDDVLEVLRAQYESASLARRDFSGAGFVTRFAVPEGVKRLSPPKTFHLGDVDAEIEGLENGAGFELFIVDGALGRLEAFTYDEKWPASVGRFKVFYHSGNTRDMESLRRSWQDFPKGL